MILDEILAHKRTEVAQRVEAMPLREIKSRLSDAPPPLDFLKRLCRNEAGLPAVIAEVKKASPSKGVIRADFDPEAIAKAYEAAGASAISVLTDERFFQGSLDYLRLVRRTVRLPVLRKDFVVDEYQVFEARAAGADAVLLIVAALEKVQLAELMNRATEIGLQALVEVHDEAELAVAVEVGAPLIGINNRNLRTFEVSLETTARLMALVRGLAPSPQPSPPGEGAGRDVLSPVGVAPSPQPSPPGEGAGRDVLSPLGAAPSPQPSPPGEGAGRDVASPPGAAPSPQPSPPGEGERKATAVARGQVRFVSESGIFTREDMVRLGAMGVDAVLIGEALMREEDIEGKLRGLIAPSPSP